MTTPTGTVLHRPGCQRPGWDVEPARAIRGVVIARCEGCGAVELRREPTTTPRLTTDRPNERNRP